MRKLSLNLDQLTVDSFDTATPAETKGTVFGEQCTCQTQCSCPGCPTCDYTCDDVTCAQSCGSCEITCDVSCWLYWCASNPTCNPSNDFNSPCCPY